MAKNSDRKPVPPKQGSHDCLNCRKKDKVISRLTRATGSKQRYFDEKWLAERWSRAVKSIQKMRYDGTGPKVTMFGRSVRYRYRDVLAYERGLPNSAPS